MCSFLPQALGEPLYRVSTGNYEYRLILRCRQEARARFSQMRKDVLEKMELLDQKHGEGCRHWGPEGHALPQSVPVLSWCGWWVPSSPHLRAWKTAAQAGEVLTWGPRAGHGRALSQT